jgi:hypothetical protein
MANQEILNYLKGAKSQGYSDSDLREALLASGWPEKDVQEAFAELSSEQSALMTQPEVAPQPETISPADQVQPVLPASSPLPTISSRPHRNNFAVIIALILVAILGTGAFFAINSLNSPQRILADSFKKLDKVSSVYIEGSPVKITAESTLSIALGYHRDPKVYSQWGFKLDHIGSSSAQNLVVDSVINRDEIYLMPVYSKLSEIEEQLRSIDPKILSFKSYQMILPVLQGQTWLQAPLPQGEFEKWTLNRSLSKEDEGEQNQVWEKLTKAISFRKVESIQASGQKYSKVTLGFKKDKLQDFIRSLSNLGLGIQESQTSRLVQIINSVDNWDSDLIEILIDPVSGYPISVTLSLPQIPPTSFTSESQTQPQDIYGFAAKTIYDNLTPVFSGDKASQIQEIVKFSLSHYNDVPEAQKPTGFIQLDQLMPSINAEVIPMVNDMLKSNQSSPTY